MFLHKYFVGGRPLTELEDIIQNLNHVLRSKRGTGYFLRNFGLSEVGFRTPEEMVTSLSAELRENIRLFEPRVQLVDIDEDYDDEGGRSHLIVALRLRSSKERLRIVVDLQKNTLDIQSTEQPERES